MPVERLMVKEPFGDYAFGHRITDPDEMKRVLASHPDFVLRERVPAPGEDEPAAGEKPAKRAGK